MKSRTLFKGYQHLLAIPLSLGVFYDLKKVNPSLTKSSLIYAGSWFATFTASSYYHVFSERHGKEKIAQRIDRALIFALISGTSTAVISAQELSPSTKRKALASIYGVCLLGAGLRLNNVNSKVSYPFYLASGWYAGFYGVKTFSQSKPAFTFLALGGLAYTIGGVVFALQKPNFTNKYYQFHDFFHTLTLIGAFSQYQGIRILSKSVHKV